MTQVKELTYAEYIALSEEEQFLHSLAQAEEMLADADAILNEDGTWIPIPKRGERQGDEPRAVGFGEDRAESDFDKT